MTSHVRAAVCTLMSTLLVVVLVPTKGMCADDMIPAVGKVLQVRVPVNSARNSISSVTASPEFVVGYRGQHYGIGLGLGFLLAQLSDDSETLKGTIYQVGPAAWFDFWQSADGFTRGNVALGVSLGRGSLTDDYPGGKDEVSGTLINAYVGIGGDYFLNPHFALGTEAGFQGTFGVNLKEEGDPDKLSASTSGLYGLVRTTIVF